MTFATFSSTIIEFAAGNLAIALPLGLIAWWLQKRGRQPFLAHLLWLVVLIKLVTPALYSLKLEAPADGGSADIGVPYLPMTGETAMIAPDPAWWAMLDWQVVAVGFWLAGSMLAFAWSISRAWRFQRLLEATSETVDPGLQAVGLQLSATLGLRRTPSIMATAANISPMVWWIGGPVHIYLPRSMIREMNRAELCDILAHELGHVGRGDHYVRWLECLVGVALWWNPVAWWARRNLRACEEICCDAFVLSKTEASRDAYAGALVSAMELLAAPTIRPGALASHVNGGFIERRIRMILSGQKVLQTPRWVRGLVLISAALLLPLGFTLAQDADELAKVRQWLESGVNSAYLTQDQAEIMLRALESAQHGAVTTFIDRDGNAIRVTRRIEVEADGVDIITNPELQRAALEKALASAEGHFRTQAETGRISPEEAKAIVEDIRNAIQTGQTSGTEFYERQFEIGLIDRATAERRLQMIEEMEQAIGPGYADQLENGRHVFKVAAIPVEAGGEVGVDFHAVEPFGVVTRTEVVSEVETE